MRLQHLASVAIVLFAAASARADGKAIANPCLLLNEAEASAALGVPAKFGMKLDQLGTCVFNDSNGVPIFSVRGSVHANRYDAYLELQDRARATPPRSQEPVFNLGDHAQIMLTRPGDLVLLIQKGDKLLVLSILHSAGPMVVERKLLLEQAGRQAAAHLQ